MPSLGASGSRQLRAIARDLKRAGSPRGVRLKLRRNITAAVQPMKAQVQANARDIPVHGDKSTGLRQQIAKATRVTISAGTRVVRVRLWVNPKKMPEGKGKLPALMEGDGTKWRHPVYGHDVWVAQPSESYFRPAIPPHLPGVTAGVLKALDETEIELSRGTYT
jgi:hypothetical protein